MPVADPAGNEVVELVRRHLFARGAPADPQAQCVAPPKIAIEMDAIGAGPEERNSTAVEAKDGWATPARSGVECLVAPLRDPTLVDERVYHGIDGAAHCRDI